jgi:uncharacterized membrane protein YbhN (UPF0104 family)
MQKETPTIHSPLVRNFYFWSGIIATFAYRIINFLTNFNPIWAQVAWYAGTVGFILYFMHRYQISEKRSRLIKEYALEKKMAESKELAPDEKEILAYIFSTLQSSKEKWNYIFIFVVSILALIIGVYFDFLAPRS